MVRFIKTGFIATLIFGCTPPATDPVIPAIPGDDTLAVLDTVLPQPDPFTDSLRAYFESPVDFYALKKETLDMHSGQSNWKEEYFHRVADTNARFYGYWAVEFDLRTNRPGRSLLFATWKPWHTRKASYYETDNETLVGIHSCIAWKWLGPSNFVGQHADSILAKFGQPDLVDHRHADSALLYTLNDKLLLLHLRDERVNWFKYYWWNDTITAADSLPAALFTWKE